MLSTRVGDDHYPGTSRPVPAWPGFAQGDRGVLNTMAPTHFRIASLAAMEPRPPVLWVRGADDVIVSDTSLYDLGLPGIHRGRARLAGGRTCGRRSRWSRRPEACLTATPHQAAITTETVIEDSGHGPHLDQPERFMAALVQHLEQGVGVPV